MKSKIDSQSVAKDILPYNTTSLCPECIKIINATVYEEDGKVMIKKTCEEHGEFVEVYWGDAEMFRKAYKFAHDGPGIENPQIYDAKCPFTCGLCKDHMSQTALLNIVLTNRCDLACWYCFFYAKRAGYVYEPTIDQIREMVRTARSLKPVPANAVQLTGGEPTLREDLVDIIKAIKEEGIDHIQLNTNGIRLALDPELPKKVRLAGCNTVYLSFDGVDEKTNPKNHNEIPKILENCRRAELGIVLVPTVIKGVNDHQLGDIIRFGVDNIDVVRGVNFQPVSLVGSMPRREREKVRITIPDAIKKIEEQTDGEISREDFYPVPSVAPMSHFVEAITGHPQYELTTHWACGMATYVFKENGRMIPITRFIDVEGLFEYLNEKSEVMKSSKIKTIRALKSVIDLRKFVDSSNAPKGFDFAKILFDVLVKHDYSTLGDFHVKALFIGMMHFQDLYNYDIERVKRCEIHYASPDGRIIPFCAFNVIPEIYRDKIQAKYGIPLDEWEKKTGKKLRDDIYRVVKKPRD
ncbi:putative Fe-S oxidoreductase [Archaeoglobus sulfaticallidus PM70-1]|uniref:Putative Fe-S oxidoreductase n=1 Tax=Archaeoglobus sulfaticallidus PM70-1 TaxID=387631 RepID=N0BDC4_9EURY|nr:radical SAM protein [Archaeoglobus sulfaticallidus]AGK60252.1 putative Fe-S oxidoreductase [Archaeoglobus sulfaticallidus PM70-1]